MFDCGDHFVDGGMMWQAVESFVESSVAAGSSPVEGAESCWAAQAGCVAMA